MALLEDRERIGRDLHDTVIQRLFATGMSLQGTARLVRNDPDEALARIEGAVDELDLTVKHIRTAIFGLERTRPTAEGLRSRVLAIAREAAGSTGFEPRVLLEGPLDTAVEDSRAAELLATLREALSNVARHAQASRHVEVTCWRTATSALLVADDGVGPPADDAPRGNGLANMADARRTARRVLQLSGQPARRDAGDVGRPAGLIAHASGRRRSQRRGARPPEPGLSAASVESIDVRLGPQRGPGRHERGDRRGGIGCVATGGHAGPKALDGDSSGARIGSRRVGVQGRGEHAGQVPLVGVRPGRVEHDGLAERRGATFARCRIRS